MLRIKKCSFQDIENIFSAVNSYKDYVLWIRNQDMSIQLYCSRSYKQIWERDLESIYKIPLIWFDYLEPEGKSQYMMSLQSRHESHYFNPDKNRLYYQILTRNNEIRFITCESYRFEDPYKEVFIVGIAKKLSPDSWHAASKRNLLKLNSEDEQIRTQVFQILKKSFGMSLVKFNTTNNKTLDSVNTEILENEKIIFSMRELECLQYLCEGKTAKETGRLLSLSPRTIETHHEKIRCKTQLGNKIEIIKSYSKYFI